MRQVTALAFAIGLAFGASFAVAEQGDIGFSASQTERTVDTFQRSIDGCMEAEPNYRVECFQTAYSATIRVVSKASAYWEAEVALTRVNRSLYSFVRANTDKSLSRLKFNGSRTRPVTPEALPQAQALYAAEVDRAVAIMRGGNSSEIKYFAPLADAVEATRNQLK